MAQGKNGNGGSWQPKTRADWIAFSLGLAGAAWEIFYDHSDNYFVYILILALLRLWQAIADLVGGLKRS